MRVGRFDINQHNTTHRDGSTDPAWTSPSTNLNSRSSQEICCILCQKMFWKLLNQQSWWNSPVKASCSKSEKWFSPPSRLSFRLILHFSPKIWCFRLILTKPPKTMQCSIHWQQFPPPPPNQDFYGPFRLRFSPRLILEHTLHTYLYAFFWRHPHPWLCLFVENLILSLW